MLIFGLVASFFIIVALIVLVIYAIIGISKLFKKCGFSKYNSSNHRNYYKQYEEKLGISKEIIIAFIILACLSLIFYVLKLKSIVINIISVIDAIIFSVASYQVAKKFGYKPAWLAFFIPVIIVSYIGISSKYQCGGANVQNVKTISVCTKCGGSVNPNDKFCYQCGELLNKQTDTANQVVNKYCEYCGKPVKVNSKFCGNCGNRINQS